MEEQDIQPAEEQDSQSESLADWTTVDFAVGEKLKDASLSETEKATQPKPRYKESTLIKELQRREIGRPSTYATIVDTVLSPTRGYCTLENKCIVPTEKGKELAAFLDRAFSGLINYDYTKELEDDLDKIANGKSAELAFLREFYNGLEGSIKANKEAKAPSGAEDSVDSDKKCPKCGGPMVVRRSRFGKLFYGCRNYPKCTGILPMD